MAWSWETTWKPGELREVAGSVDTSTGVTEVTTDAGRAFIKPLGNRQGPHVLATDWVGTHLARWFGLSTFEVAILNLDNDDRFQLPHGYFAEPGPAFATRALHGEPWGRSGLQLDMLSILKISIVWWSSTRGLEIVTGTTTPRAAECPITIMFFCRMKASNLVCGG